MTDVFARTEEHRAALLRDAETLAEQMDGGTPVADLETVEAELLEQLADVRARKAEREPLEREYAKAVHMASVLAREIREGRRLYEPPPAAQALAATMPPGQPAPPPIGDVAVAGDPNATVVDPGRLPFRGGQSVAQDVVAGARQEGADPSGGLTHLADVSDQQGGDER